MFELIGIIFSRIVKGVWHCLPKTWRAAFWRRLEAAVIWLDGYDRALGAWWKSRKARKAERLNEKRRKWEERSDRVRTLIHTARKDRTLSDELLMWWHFNEEDVRLMFRKLIRGGLYCLGFWLFMWYIVCPNTKSKYERESEEWVKGNIAYVNYNPMTVPVMDSYRDGGDVVPTEGDTIPVPKWSSHNGDTAACRKQFLDTFEKVYGQDKLKYMQYKSYAKIEGNKVHIKAQNLKDLYNRYLWMNTMYQEFYDCRFDSIRFIGAGGYWWEYDLHDWYNGLKGTWQELPIDYNW